MMLAVFNRKKFKSISKVQCENQLSIHAPYLLFGERYFKIEIFFVDFIMLCYFFQENQFFHNADWLNSWRKAGKTIRPSMPGHNYFDYLETIKKTHTQVGELYMEFLKCESQNCTFCAEIPGQIVERVPRPFPNPETQHYAKYEETPKSENRPVDDYQPRKKCKDLYDLGELSVDSPQNLADFAKNFLVDQCLIIDHLKHLSDLKLKKDLRKEKKPSKKRKRNEGKQHKPTVNVEEEDGAEEDEGGESEEEEDEENDLILNEITGSDMEEDSVRVYVPPLKTVTRRGKITGLWQKNFSLCDSDSDDDDHAIEPVKTFRTTRSGRKAGYLQSKYL